jgi:hypothetical protein
MVIEELLVAELSDVSISTLRPVEDFHFHILIYLGVVYFSTREFGKNLSGSNPECKKPHLLSVHEHR